MTLGTAEWRLGIVWMIGSGLLFLVLVAQSMGDYYDPRTEEAWGWFLPAVMPTLSLIVGTLFGDTAKPAVRRQRIQPRLFRLAVALSVFYLLAVAASVFTAPLVARNVTPLDLMQLSNLWLGPLQGIVAGSLGVFYRQSAKT